MDEIHRTAHHRNPAGQQFEVKIDSGNHFIQVLILADESDQTSVGRFLVRRT